MIGCLIFGGLAAMAIGRAMHHRRMHHAWGGCHGGGGLRHGGGFGPGWGGRGGGGRGFGSYDFGEDGAGWEGPFGGGGGFGEPPFAEFGRRGHRHGKRFFVRAILEQVRATPAQERAIGDAVEEFRDELKKAAGGEGRRSRQEIVEAFRKPTFDGVMLGEQFARHDTTIEVVRKAFVGLVAKVHDALEPEQRERLAELIERGPRFGRWARGW